MIYDSDYYSKNEDGKEFKDIESKITNSDFNFSKNELDLLSKISNNYNYYVYYNLINNTLVYKEAQLSGKPYDDDHWERYFNFFKSLNSKFLNHFIYRTIRYNVLGSINLHEHDDQMMEHNSHNQKICKNYVKHLASKREVDGLKSTIKTTMKSKYFPIPQTEKMINMFVPEIWKNFDQFITEVIKSAHRTQSDFEIIEKISEFASDKQINTLYSNLENVLLIRKLNYNNRRVVLHAFGNQKFVDHIKNNYTEKHQQKITNMLNKADFREFEENDYACVKAVLQLDNNFLDLAQKNYINAVYARNVGHFGSNINKIYKFLKTFKDSSPKKALMELSKLNRSNDIKFLIKKFPDLKKLELLI